MSEKLLNQEINEVFQSSVHTQIGGDREHGWVADDSIGVIEDVVAADIAWAAKAKQPYKGLSVEAKDHIAFVINPSAARQAFERAGLLNEPTTKGARRGGLSAMMKASVKPMVKAGTEEKGKAPAKA